MRISNWVVPVFALAIAACGSPSDGGDEAATESSSASALDSFGRSLIGSYEYVALAGSYQELRTLTLRADGTYVAEKPGTGASAHESGTFTASAASHALTLKPSRGASRRYTVQLGDGSLQLSRGGRSEVMAPVSAPPPPPDGGSPVDPSCATRRGGAFVRFTVAGESLTVWSTDAAFIDESKRLLTSGEHRTPSFDRVIDGADCDAAYSWHVDPAKMAYADFTTEVCDGTPSYIEANKATWIRQVGRYCPWGPTVSAVDDRRATSH